MSAPAFHSRPYYVGIAAFFGALAAFALLSVGFGAHSTDRFMPHGVCYQWQPNLMRLHAISDALIGLAYIAIPLALLRFVRKRADVPFNWMFALFGVFIVACGATHWMDVWTLWHPDYWLSGAVKAITAAASVPTAILLFVLLPKAVAMPSLAQILNAKAVLEAEVRQRQRTEVQLEEAKAELERRVEARTAELSAANAQLERQRADLEVANRMKGDFLAVLSHELRNPIHAIRASAWVMKARAPGAGDGREVEAIERQITKLTRLLEELLDVVAVSRHAKLRVRTVDLRAVANAALHTTRRLFQQRKQAVRLTAPAEAVPVDVDDARLEQAVANVLNNASKYTPDGGAIAIEIGTEGGDAFIKVRDSGIGIGREELPHVFDLFRRGGTAKAASQDGLGVGLHVANELVIALGGSIEVASAGPGEGSEFAIRIPRSSQPLEATARGEEASAVPASQAALRVLVVDDNRDAADMLRLLLEMNGHDAVVAYEGNDALEKARTFRPEVALIDIGLPTISGYQVADAINPGGEPRRVTTVAVTGWGADEDKARAAEHGFDFHLTKPIDPTRLLELLQSIAEKRAP